MAKPKKRQHTCGLCGKKFAPRHSNHKWCSGECRERARSPKVELIAAPDPEPEDGDLVDAVIKELAEAKALSSVNGQLAVMFARSIESGGTGAGLTAMAEKLQSMMKEATGGAGASDAIDELRKQREARQRRG